MDFVIMLIFLHSSFSGISLQIPGIIPNKPCILSLELKCVSLFLSYQMTHSFSPMAFSILSSFWLANS